MQHFKPIILVQSYIYISCIANNKDDKNIIGAPKMRNTYSFYRFCDSNIGLFSIGPCKVIALPTVVIAIVVVPSLP